MVRRAFTLPAVLAFVALCMALGLASHVMIESVLGRLAVHKASQSAAQMADAGLDYARYMLRRGRWRGLRRFQSPMLGVSQQFQVDVYPMGGGRYRIEAVGQAGRSSQRREAAFP